MFFLRKISISAFSAVSRFLFSSTMLDAVLNSLSLSTLVEGALRNLTAVAARIGKRAWLFPQYSKGLSLRGIVSSFKYVCIWITVLLALSDPGSSCSSRMFSYRLVKLLWILLGPAASMRGTFSSGPVASDSDSLALCSISSIFSISCVRAVLVCSTASSFVKYLIQKIKQVEYKKFQHHLESNTLKINLTDKPLQLILQIIANKKDYLQISTFGLDMLLCICKIYSYHLKGCQTYFILKMQFYII